MEFHSHHHPHLAHAEEHTFSHAHITALRVFNVLAFIFLIVFNALAYTGGFRDGLDNAQVSAWYHTYLTPAPWTFSIWFLIFILQGLFVIYQALPFYNTVHSNSFLGRLSFFLPVSWILEGLWLVSFVYEWMWLSLIFMVLILGMLAIGYIRLFSPPLHLIHVLQSHEYLSHEKWRLSFYWLIFHLPTSMNYAWIATALMVNFLVFLHWMNVITGVWLPIIQIIIAAVLAIFHLIWFRDSIFSLTVAWGLFGVASHHDHVTAIEVAGYFVGSMLLLASILVIILLSLRVWRGREGLDVGTEKGPLLPASSH